MQHDSWSALGVVRKKYKRAISGATTFVPIAGIVVSAVTSCLRKVGGLKPALVGRRAETIRPTRDQQSGDIKGVDSEGNEYSSATALGHPALDARDNVIALRIVVCLRVAGKGGRAFHCNRTIRVPA